MRGGRQARQGTRIEGLDALLVEVLERGWSRRRRREFIARYGRTIRGSILYHIRMKFGEQSLAAIGDYLRSLQEGRQPCGKGGVIGEVLDLAADTWQDVLNEVFKVRDNLVHKYHRYIARTGGEGRGLTSFSYFLSKNVQYKFLDNLKARLTDKKIPEEKVHGGTSGQEAATPSIAVDADEEAVIAGAPTGTGTRTETEAGAEAEKVPLNDEVNYYWDQLIRCLEPDPRQVEELIKLRPSEGNVLCWACARLKRGLKRREQKENLIAFIVFYASKRGIGDRDRRDRDKDEEGAPTGSEGLSPDNLTLERVIGRDLRWREDICRGIFRKYIRKDRVMEQIRREIMDSDYRYLIAEGREG